MIKQAFNKQVSLLSVDTKTEFNKYTCGKKYFVVTSAVGEVESACQEYSGLVLTALKDILKYRVSVMDTDCFAVTFTEDADVKDFTDSLKAALRRKFKGGRLTKPTIRNQCVTFPNKNYLLIDVINGWKT